MDTQSRWLQTTPLPHEDFEPYLSQFTEYDSLLEQGLSNIQELDIQAPPLMNVDGYFLNSAPLGVQDFHNQSTFKPSTLAKYSKMMNLNNFAATSETLTEKNFPLTPAPSPLKSSALGSGSFLQPPNYNNNARILHTPSLQLTPQGSSQLAKGRFQITPSSPTFDLRNGQPCGYTHESDSDYLSEAAFSPTMDSTPEMPNTSRFHGPAIGEINVFSSVDMGPVDPKSTIAWQPVLTAPKNDFSQEIIKSQRSSKGSNRKSCLPPGKVDSYMAGPNEEGLFECLFPNCRKLFRRRYNVRSHIQTHLCDRPYACDVCGASFVRPHDLRRHSRCHQDERPYSCPCGKAFNRHDALHRHRIRMICIGGLEVPGKPKRAPAKRGRPRKNPSAQYPPSYNDSESEHSSPYSSSEHEMDFMKAEMVW